MKQASYQWLAGLRRSRHTSHMGVQRPKFDGLAPALLPAFTDRASCRICVEDPSQPLYEATRHHVIIFIHNQSRDRS